MPTEPPSWSQTWGTRDVEPVPIDPKERRFDELAARARALLTNAELGVMGRSEYDTAWVARVPIPGTHEPAFPAVLGVVRASQRSDGSWGPPVPYNSARVLATLASVLALHDFGHAPGDEERIRRGLEYLIHTWPLLSHDPDLTVGFELLSAALLEDACKRGMPLDNICSNARNLRASKLSRIPAEFIYSPNLSIGHSLEFLGDSLDVERARALQTTNGSIGATIATTAYFAWQTGDAAAMRYLEQCVDVFGPNNLPYGHPADLWAKIWVLYNLHIGELTPLLGDIVEPHLDFIERNIGRWGLSWSSLVEYGDADDTAVGLMLLACAGRPVDWQLLRNYEGEQCYLTYVGETHPSTSANAHVLSAMTNHPDAFEASSVRKVAGFLLRQQQPKGYWTDKWHASPYYSTSRAVRALVHHDTTSGTRHAISWILESQRPNGMWGFYQDATAEETAYCIHALAAWNTIEGGVPRSVFESGLHILNAGLQDLSRTATRLWIEKTLYYPAHIVHAAVLAAASLCVRELARSSQPPSS